MALVKCIGCGQMMSDKADFCPHCGMAMRAENTQQDTQRQLATLRPSKPDNTGDAIAGSLIFISALGLIAFVALLIGGWWAYNNILNHSIADVLYSDVDTTAPVGYVDGYSAADEMLDIVVPDENSESSDVNYEEQASIEDIVEKAAEAVVEDFSTDDDPDIVSVTVEDAQE